MPAVLTEADVLAEAAAADASSAEASALLLPRRRLRGPSTILADSIPPPRLDMLKVDVMLKKQVTFYAMRLTS